MKDIDIVKKLMEMQFGGGGLLSDKGVPLLPSGYAMIGKVSNPHAEMFERNYSFNDDPTWEFDFMKDRRETDKIFPELEFTLISKKDYAELVSDESLEIAVIGIMLGNRPVVVIRKKA